MSGVRKAGARIEEILGGLPPGPAREAAEELVRELLALYGEGLEHVVSVVGAADTALVGKLAEDPLVEGLLLLHGLHPLDAGTRAQRALDRVRPYLGSHAGGVEFLGIDEAAVARLRLSGSCNGCASSAQTVKLAIEDALLDAVPEISAIEVEGMAADPGPALLQIGSGPPGAAAATDGTEGDAWAALPDAGPPTGRPTAVNVEGMRLVLCSFRGTLYAYRDRCPACGGAVSAGAQNGDVLTCPGCGHRYDVRVAGRCIDDGDFHLDPLPLLSDSHGTRVAIPKPAVR
ncbi:NifU family protein [Actinospica sp. MGRD01-02]|uniref:NifU family protein n=1 Tax=Actinospica acidithermotolerans TaxID=2828514 RepID=A0A941IIQ2_9ACTN|nr:NifU family protein [Actinospica acidithermotolerans]MBR7827037.1 NifU family protein [Actinospica acidithermotolerans]